MSQEVHMLRVNPVVPLALAVTLVACGDDGGTTDEPIRFGVVASLSGDLALFAEDLNDTLVLGRDEINDNGGLLGRQLELDVQDDGTTGPGASVAYSTVLSHGAPAVIGPVHSAGVLDIAAQIRTGKTLTISGTVTSPEIATFDDGGYFFRTIPSDAVQGIVLAQKMVEEGVENLCLVYRTDAYGNGLAGSIMGHLPSEVIVHPVPFNPNAASLSGVAEDCDPVLTMPGPGAAFVTFEGDGRVILDEAAERGWNATDHRLFLVDGNKRQELVDALVNAAAFEGVVGTAPSGPDPETDAGLRRAAFRERFKNEFGREVAGEAENHYDALWLAAAAIQLAGTVDDPEAIRAAMGRTAGGPTVEVGDWAGVRAAVESDDSLDFLGASGDINLGADSGELLPPYYISLWTITDGEISEGRVVIVETP
jgi:branched-chain amino acid transport system substrate-binding protein